MLLLAEYARMSILPSSMLRLSLVLVERERGQHSALQTRVYLPGSRILDLRSELGFIHLRRLALCLGRLVTTGEFTPKGGESRGRRARKCNVGRGGLSAQYIQIGFVSL